MVELNRLYKMTVPYSPDAELLPHLPETVSVFAVPVERRGDTVDVKFMQPTLLQGTVVLQEMTVSVPIPAAELESDWVLVEKGDTVANGKVKGFRWVP